jgi:hypothetical protein
MCMRRRVAPAARARPMVPIEPTAGGAASYSAVQLRRGPRAAHGPVPPAAGPTAPEHAARCRSCGVADGVVNQVGPSGTAHGSSELVKAHTSRRGRPSCRNTGDQGSVQAMSGTGSAGRAIGADERAAFRVTWRRSPAESTGRIHAPIAREPGPCNYIAH